MKTGIGRPPSLDAVISASSTDAGIVIYIVLGVAIADLRSDVLFSGLLPCKRSLIALVLPFGDITSPAF
jgi:hypothetical protein